MFNVFFVCVLAAATAPPVIDYPSVELIKLISDLHVFWEEPGEPGAEAKIAPFLYEVWCGRGRALQAGGRSTRG